MVVYDSVAFFSKFLQNIFLKLLFRAFWFGWGCWAKGETNCNTRKSCDYNPFDPNSPFLYPSSGEGKGVPGTIGLSETFFRNLSVS